MARATGVDRGVVLDGPVDRQVRAALLDQRGGAHLVDVGARAGPAGRVRQHRHARVDAEPGHRVGRRDGDVGQLLGGGVGDDSAVAVHQHPVLEHMKNTDDTIEVPGVVG